ncbi:hypothetical protein Droror1_Dr00004943 [Drosera rotundifolia]
MNAEMDASILCFHPFSSTRLYFLPFYGLREELDGNDEEALGFMLGAVAAAVEFDEELLGDVVHPQEHEDRPRGTGRQDEEALGLMLGAVATAGEFGEELLGDVVHPQQHED